MATNIMTLQQMYQQWTINYGLSAKAVH